jgi:ribonucleotide reductase alpha subunit
MSGHIYSQVLEASEEYFGGDEFAAKVFVDKYALQAPDGTYLELTPEAMHHRLAKQFARIEQKYPNPISEESIFALLDRYKFIVPQGSPMSAIGNPYQLQSLSNCFVIQGVHSDKLDSYGGIMLADQELAQIMKRRGGVGLDISGIRPKNVITNNAAKTTDGLGVFMERFSNTCREVAQNGRRGAEMITISINHPEIETFINIKRNLTKVTGANISIRLNDEFMMAVKNDEEYTLRWPVEHSPADAKVTKQVRAKDIWDQIVDSAWTSAEPGLLFWDTVKKNTPSDIYHEFGHKSISTNPCIIGSTLIAVADGRNAVSIEQLALEGKDVPVYSTDVATGQVQIKFGRNPRKTGIKSEVWKLTLDDGSVLIATPNHKVLSKDLSYVELKDLSVGMPVYPFYSFDSNGYRQVSNSGAAMVGGARRNRRQYRLIHEFNYPGHQYVDPKEFAIHHKDFDSLNDRYDNLQILTHEEHQTLHSEKMMGKLNPYHRMDDEWKHNFASHPGNKNSKWINVSNEELIERGKKLFLKYGKLTEKIWHDYAKENGLPVFLGNKARFGKFPNFRNQVASNHKVVSVEFYGYEDVYNITVDDNHNYHVITSSEDDRHITSSGLCVKNCGEIVLPAYDACRLLVLNLASYVKNPFTKDAVFDFKKFHQHTIVAQRLMDDIIDLEIECIDRIIAKIENDPEPEEVKAVELALWHKIRHMNMSGRRTGLGITALGDALAMLGIKYGAAESIDMTRKIYRALAVGSHTSSCILAKERGAFPIFNYELEKDHAYLKSIFDDCPREVRRMWKTTGRRNIANTTTAPAGSVSSQTRTSSGIESVFMLEHIRRKKHNPSDKNARVDFVDAMGDCWQEFTVYHHGVKMWMDVTGETDITKSPYFGATANEIDWIASVDLQAAAQESIDHSISKTCNLPETATKELVSQIYMRAWEKGCKGFTVYRDKCRDGVLISKSAEPKIKDGRPADILDCMAPKRPLELPCEIKKAKIQGEQWTIFVGLLNGKPYEVFGGLSKYVDIPNKFKMGRIVKNGKVDDITTYNLLIGEGEDQMAIKNIANVFENANFGAFTRTISLALRHGTPIQYVVEQLQKDKHSDVTSFSKVISRVLKNYIADGTKSTSERKCPSCGNTKLAYQQGCMQCIGGTMKDGTVCTWSKC